MRTVWTPLGIKSLEKTTDFIEEQWNEDVAEKFLDRLDERIEQLKKNPRIGPTFEQTEYRELLIHPLVTLYYELKTDPIDELREKLKRM